MQCDSISDTWRQCTLHRWHGDVHRAPSQKWITDPRDQPVCARCQRRRGRHGPNGRDLECPDGFAPHRERS